jgi:hypothetical protein
VSKGVGAVLRAASLVAVIVTVVPASADAGRSSGSTRPATRAQLLVSGLKTRAGAVPLAGQVLDGRMYVYVSAGHSVRSAKLFLDKSPRGRPSVTLTARRGSFAPWRLDTGKLRDGAHVLTASISLRSGRRVTVRVRFRVSNHGPASAGLIANALAQHRIDYGTSLLYRFYAFWGDPRLPAAFRGAETGGDDAMAFEAVAAIASGRVRGAEAARLRPFLLRPSDPRSAYHRGAGARAAAAPAGECNVSKAPTPSGEIGQGNDLAWVWGYQDDTQTPRVLPRLLEIVTKYLGAEEKDMGKTVPDSLVDCAKANPTTGLDVYVTSSGYAVPRDLTQTPPKNTYAVTVPSCSAAGCTSFILLNAPMLPYWDIVEVTLVHELFHVLQFAHLTSYKASDHWFTEASAEWAETHYTPKLSIQQSENSSWYLSFQKQTAFSIGSSCTECRMSYASWIWPFFMEQEGASVFTAWTLLPKATDNASATRILDGLFPFATHLRDFAVRDLNFDYHDKGSSQPGPRFQYGDVAADWLPLDSPEDRLVDETTLSDTGRTDRTVTTHKPGSLDFRWTIFNLPDKSKVRYAKFDFSKLGGETDVDALVQVAGQRGYERRPLNGKTLEFCRDDSGDDISRVIAVVSNHSLTGESPSDSEITYQTASTCGRYHLTGNLKVTATGTSPLPGGPCGTDPYDNFSSTFTGNANLDLYGDPTNSALNDSSESDFTGSYSGEMNNCNGGSDVFSATFPKHTVQATPSDPNTHPIDVLWWFTPDNPHVDVSVTFSADGSRTDGASGLSGGDACSFADGQTTNARESAILISGIYTVPMPQQPGQKQTITVDDTAPGFNADGDCFEGPFDVHVTGTLTVEAPAAGSG